MNVITSENLPSTIRAFCRVLLGLCVLPYLITISAAQNASTSRGESYPNVWFRLFDDSEDILEAFLSDSDIWGNEPVVILNNSKTGQHVAVGFFSGKRQEIYATVEGRACTPILLNHYFYAQTKREMKRRYITQQELCNTYVKVDDTQSTVKVGEDAILERGLTEVELLPPEVKEIFRVNAFDKSSTAGGYALIGGREAMCEPLKNYLVKKNKEQKIIWSKSFVRIYPIRDLAPEQKEERCISEKTLVQSEITSFLILPDDTLLVLVPNAVIRIRQKDGGPPFSSPTLRVFNTADVIRVKLDLMRAQALAAKRCDPVRKSKKEYKSCSLYQVNQTDLERLQIDLAKSLFQH